MQILFIFLGVFFVLALLGKIPVAFSMGIASVVTFLYARLPVINMAQAAFSTLDTLPFLAVPFFILSGTIMEYTGISKSLLDMIDSIIGRIKGSIGVLTIVGSAAFGILTGSAMATISAIGKVMAPGMISKGYKKGYIGALLASTSFLGFLIPPSIPGILYAMASSTSVAKVWLSTIGPAILFVVAYSIINYLRYGRYENEIYKRITINKYIKNMGIKIFYATPALLMPIIIFGGIYGGVTTATEAGSLSVVYGMTYYIVKKIFNRNKMSGNLWQIFLTSASVTASIVVIMIFANVSSRAITLSGLSNEVATWAVSNFHNPVIFLLVVNVIYFIMGTFLDINCSLLLMTPLLLPVATVFGIDPVHFGAITIVNLSVGLMTPPFALGIFMGCKVAETNFVDVVREIWPFIISGIVITLLTTYIEIIPMFFVRLLG